MRDLTALASWKLGFYLVLRCPDLRVKDHLVDHLAHTRARIKQPCAPRCFLGDLARLRRAVNGFHTLTSSSGPSRRSTSRVTWTLFLSRSTVTFGVSRA